MSRRVCFFDEEEGQTAICIREDENCTTCDCNPFPGRIIPKDRVLLKKRIRFEYEPLTDEEYTEMISGRDVDEPAEGTCHQHLRYRIRNRANARSFHHRKSIRR
jgi:hypothetical protein